MLIDERMGTFLLRIYCRTQVSDTLMPCGCMLNGQSDVRWLTKQPATFSTLQSIAANTSLKAQPSSTIKYCPKFSMT